MIPSPLHDGHMCNVSGQVRTVMEAVLVLHGDLTPTWAEARKLLADPSETLILKQYIYI